MIWKANATDNLKLATHGKGISYGSQKTKNRNPTSPGGRSPALGERLVSINRYELLPDKAASKSGLPGAELASFFFDTKPAQKGKRQRGNHGD